MLSLQCLVCLDPIPAQSLQQTNRMIFPPRNLRNTKKPVKGGDMPFSRSSRICWSTTAASCACLCFVASCAVDRIPFPVSEYESLLKTGSATVVGEAFLRTRGGDVKTAAGYTVFLNPVTSYSRQWHEVSYLHGRALSRSDPRIEQYVRSTTADSAGRFRFTNVPAGDYYVVTDVVWETPVGYVAGMERQGGKLVKEIHIDEGQTAEIILTDQY